MITLKGLIIRERNIGESNRMIIVLTEKLGIINVFIRGGAKSKKTLSSTQLFSYSKMCLEMKVDAKGLNNYYLNSSEALNLFYNIRLDPIKTSLAYYFAELLCFSRIEDAYCSEVYKLTMNTFYFLDKGNHDNELLKSIFEFRLLCEMGFRPYLVGCNTCYICEPEIMHYNYKSGKLECDNCCYNPDSIFDISLDRDMLYIVRYIALTDYSKLFHFRINKKYQEKLTEFTERFVKYNFKDNFATLDFYKTISKE